MPPTIPDKIPCESVDKFKVELAALAEVLSLSETEETWDRIERALARFTAVVKGGGHKFEKELVDGMKSVSRPIINSVNSERTRLSMTTLDCLAAIAPRIGSKFDTLVPLFVPVILRLSNRTNKVYVTRSQATIALIIGYCHLPSIVPHLLTACKDSKIATGRIAGAEGILRALNKWDWEQKDIKTKIGDVEEALRLTGRDKDPAVRQISRKVFEAYKTLFPDRLEEFSAPLTPVIKKYLDIRATDRGRTVAPTNLSASTSAAPSAHAAAAIKLHARSASSHAIVEKSALSSGTAAPKIITHTRTEPMARVMLPPAAIPSRQQVTRPTPRTRDGPSPSPSDGAPGERQRLLSNASSTFSVKSAPSNTRPVVDHKPPIRLASSTMSRPASTAPVTSGQARRVRRVISVEPHPANRPDLFALAQKALTRPNSVQSKNGGVAFPRSDGATAIERKGPQRIPRPPPPPVPTVLAQAEDSAAPSKEAKSADAIAPPKEPAKPSIIRKAAAAAVSVDKTKGAVEKTKEQDAKIKAVSEKETESGDKVVVPKPKEGFVPRRGGLTQPTLSQLNKQKPPVVASTAVPSRTRAMSITSKKGPIGGFKPTAPKARTVSTPIAPGKEKPVDKAAIPPVPPLPCLQTPPETVEPSASGESTEVSSELATKLEEEAPVMVDNAEVEEEALIKGGSADAEDNSATVATEGSDELPGAQDEEQEADDTQGTEESEAVPEIDQAQEEIPVANDVDTRATPSPLLPNTPPFPASESADESDDLEDIEFTKGELYGPSGAPLKTPRKLAAMASKGLSVERRPLGEMVLNE